MLKNYNVTFGKVTELSNYYFAKLLAIEFSLITKLVFK